MSKSVADEDLTRYLDKWEDTAKRCFEFFTKTSEAAAAQHLGDKVFYSPICNRLHEMQQDINILRARLGEAADLTEADRFGTRFLGPGRSFDDGSGEPA